MTKIIEVVVRPNGSTSLETKGFLGRECLEASRFIEQALGASSHEHLTSEFYQERYVERGLHQGS